MKKVHTDHHIFSYFICILMLSLCSIPSQGQGWSLGFYIGLGQTVAGSNSVPHLGDFVDGRLFVSSFVHEDDEIVHYHFCQITEHGLSGCSATSGTVDDQSDRLPVANLMRENAVYVLTQHLPMDSESADVYLAYHTGTVLEGSDFLLLSREWYRPILTGEDEDYRAAAMQLNTNNQIMVTGTGITYEEDGGITQDIFLLQSDLEGQVNWVVTLPFPGESEEVVQLISHPTAGYWLLMNTPDGPWLLKTDLLGNLEWEMPLAADLGDQASDMVLTAAGNLVLTGRTAADELFVMQVDEDGNQDWRQTYAGSNYVSTAGAGIIEDQEGYLLAAGEAVLSAGNEHQAFLVKLRPDGTPLWERHFGALERAQAFNDITRTPSGQYLMAGYWQRDVGEASTGSYFVQTDTFGIAKSGLITGNVAHDLDLNCQNSAGDWPLQDWIVRASSDSLSFFTHTDPAGNYRLAVDVEEGQQLEYTLSVEPPSNYWAPCANDVPLIIDYLDTVSVDFSLQSLVDCPLMVVDLAVGRTRLCDTTTIFVNYCNYGTVAAEDANVEVTLPGGMAYFSSSSPPASVIDSVYTFDLGNVGINECGVITIEAELVCDLAYLRTTACVEATIYPDTVCMVPGINWSGALVQASYTCDDGDVQFRIENVGSGTMVEELQYVIIEDAVLLMEGTYQLNPAEAVLPDPINQGAATYTLLAQQEAGAPGEPILSIGAEVCDTENPNTLTHFDQFSGDPFTDTHCFEIVGSSNPNDLGASPAGYGAAHGILANTNLQYNLNFQNTSTDTVFRVVIRDTIANELDLATLRPLAASHPYSWHLEERVLVFSFHDIVLPDSTSNPAASQGFISYEIAQVEDLPAGTEIENRAGIYFDFDSPIITNTIFHTVERFVDLITSSVEVTDPALRVNVIPNPVLQGAKIQLAGGSFSGEQLQLHLYDMTGRPVRVLSSTASDFWLDRGALPGGIYIFRIKGAAGPLASGKLILQ